MLFRTSVGSAPGVGGAGTGSTGAAPDAQLQQLQLQRQQQYQRLQQLQAQRDHVAHHHAAVKTQVIYIPKSIQFHYRIIEIVK